MPLIHFLKIVFWIIATRHSIAWVSYHIRHHNKKAKVYRGNCRIHKAVWLALTEGININPKYLSYRKSLSEYWRIINSHYSPGSKLNILLNPVQNPNLTDAVTNGNPERKLFQFPQLKKGNNDFFHISPTNIETAHSKKLKILHHHLPYPTQILKGEQNSCFAFSSISLSHSFLFPLSNQSAHWHGYSRIGTLTYRCIDILASKATRFSYFK